MNDIDVGYDPNLKQAAAEIKSILRKYEVGGFISLSSKTHSEFVLEFPTWSLAQFNDTKDAIMLRSKKEDFQSLDLQREALEVTLHLLFSTRDNCTMCFGGVDQVINLVESKIKVEHKPFKNYKKHQDQ